MNGNRQRKSPWPLEKLYFVFLYFFIDKEKVTVLSLAFGEVENRRHSLELDEQQKPTQNFQFFSCFLFSNQNSSWLKFGVIRCSWIISTTEQNGALLIADYRSEIPSHSNPTYRFERSKPLDDDSKKTRPGYTKTDQHRKKKNNIMGEKEVQWSTYNSSNGNDSNDSDTDYETDNIFIE